MTDGLQLNAQFPHLSDEDQATTSKIKQLTSQIQQEMRSMTAAPRTADVQAASTIPPLSGVFAKETAKLGTLVERFLNHKIDVAY